jgi:hypothetical protein
MRLRKGFRFGCIDFVIRVRNTWSFPLVARGVARYIRKGEILVHSRLG